MKKIILYFATAFLFFSCASKSSELSYSGTDASPKYDMAEEETIDTDKKSVETEDISKAIEKKIIKNGTLTVEVKDIKTEKQRIDSLVHRFGAYYDKETLNNDYNSTSFNLIIRVPANSFELFISLVEKGNNDVKFKEIDAQDVTETFIDLETRLTNKRKYMERYQDLLKSAKSVKEILEIQEKIRTLEEEIESTTGRLKYLSNQVNLSTLELNITQEKEFKYIPGKRQKASEKLKQSFVGGWFVFVDFLYFLLYNWVFLILIGTGVYFWMKVRRKRKAAKKKNDK